MKKSKKIFIILIVLISAIAVVGVGYGKVYTHFISEAQVEHKDIKQIDLSTLEKIIITIDGEKTEFDKEQDNFENIKSVFNNKKVKFDSDNFHNYSDEFPKIEFITLQNDYTLYLDNSTIGDSYIYFVLYDYSNHNTNELLYQGTKISKSEFDKIFEIMQNGDCLQYSVIIN